MIDQESADSDADPTKRGAVGLLSTIGYGYFAILPTP